MRRWYFFATTCVEGKASNNFDLDYQFVTTSNVPCTQALDELYSTQAAEHAYEGVFIFFLLTSIAMLGVLLWLIRSYVRG